MRFTLYGTVDIGFKLKNVCLAHLIIYHIIVFHVH